MAGSSDFRIWISQGKDERTRMAVYVNPNTTIREIKLKYTEKTREDPSKFSLYKDDDNMLDDKSTVHDCNVTKGAILRTGEQQKSKKLKKAISYSTVSPYDTRKRNRPRKRVNSESDNSTLDPGQKETPFRKRPPEKGYTSTVDLPLKENKDSQPHIHAQLQKDVDKGVGGQEQHNLIPDAALPVKTEISICSSVKRPWPILDTAFFERVRPLSRRNTRSSSMSDLSDLDTEILCDQEAGKALELANSQSNTECLKFSEALKPFLGDLIASIHNADLLSAKLLQEGLVTDLFHRDIINTLGWANSLKATKLLDLVSIQLKTSPQPLQVLKGFCNAIMHDPALKTFIPKIEQNLGGIHQLTTRSQSPNYVGRIATSLSRCEKCVITEIDISNIVFRTAIDAQRKWFVLGAVLGLKLEELNEIKQKHSDLPGSCYTEMIGKWVCSPEHKQFPPTWQKLTRHLIRPLELTELGIELRKEYCKDCCYFGYT